MNNLEVKVILLQLPFQYCAQDCEMSFVCQDDVLQLFEGMIRAIFKSGLVGELFFGFPVLQIIRITHSKGE